MIDELLCNEDKSIIDAMCVINNNSKGIVIVVDNGGVLVGVLTDGDIRRAIIGKVELDSCIKKIVSNNCIFGNIREEKSKLVQKISHGVTILPIVDDSNKVVDYFEYRANTYFPVADLNFSGNEFKYLVDAFTSGWISANGTYIRNFENHFSSYVDCKHGIAVSNGTVALHLALTALDIGEGDEVIIPDLTFAATINAVLHANAVPVIVDVEEESWCINPKKISDAITHKTRAIIPVHLYGQSCNMEAIMELAIKYDLKVIEDCAEAHGASFRGRKVGSFGDVGCFSFFGNKIITTGEGGMCVTNNIDLMEKMRILCNHGMSKNKKYWHDYVGYNYRMTNLQAAIGLAQLEYIDTIHENRRFFEVGYKKTFPEGCFTFQKDLKGRGRVVWLVSVLVNGKNDRDAIIQKMRSKNIDARPFFYPLSSMDIYQQYCAKPTKISHMISKIGLNLPTYANLKNYDIMDKISS